MHCKQGCNFNVMGQHNMLLAIDTPSEHTHVWHAHCMQLAGSTQNNRLFMQCIEWTIVATHTLHGTTKLQSVSVLAVSECAAYSSSGELMYWSQEMLEGGGGGRDTHITSPSSSWPV